MKLFRNILGDGPPLIIMHGLLGASGNWQSLAKNQFGERYKTIAVDLRNHGRSPHSDTNSYQDMVGDILELMDDEDIDTAHILGHSMGGKLAMHLALEHPDRVEKLIVADIAPRAYQRSHDSIFGAFYTVDLNHATSRADVDDQMKAIIQDNGVRQFLLKNLTRTDSHFTWGMNLQAIEANYEHLLSEVEAWEAFEGDVLFIRGGQSSYVQDSDLLAIRALFPFATLETIEEAGHWLHAEQPEEFARLCLEFLG